MKPAPLSPAEVVYALGLRSRTSLYELLKKESSFPAPFRPMGPRGWPRWFPEDVEAWKKRRQLEESGGVPSEA